MAHNGEPSTSHAHEDGAFDPVLRPLECALLLTTDMWPRTYSMIDGDGRQTMASEAGMFWRIVEGTIVTLIVAVAMAIVGVLGYLLLPMAGAAVWTALLAPVLFTGLVVGAILIQSCRA
jgi:hypothetical protein